MLTTAIYEDLPDTENLILIIIWTLQAHQQEQQNILRKR